ncbi:MAG: flagellar hook-basal body complex protein FliE [Planctomycetota bacterium]|nr:flagellar hook-basal body complex protein FliE [Planctomycetota bacterium]
MIDPIGMLGPNRAAGLTPRTDVAAPAGPGQTEGQGPVSFKDLLMKNLGEVNELQKDATSAIEDLQTGRRNDVESVLIATAKADTAFRMLLAVRNKMMDAYEEIKQIRV